MSEATVKSFERGVEAWNRDNFDSWIDNLDPGIERFALMEVFHGHAGARQAWESFKGDMYFSGELASWSPIATVWPCVCATSEAMPRPSKSPGCRNSAMSEENVQTVRRVYERVNARLETPRELFDPDYEFDNTELWPDLVEVLGFEAAQEAMREYWETFEAYHVEIEEVIHADEGRVVNLVRDGGRMRGSDAQVSNRFFHVWTFRDGRIVRLSVHTDRNRALEVAGLSA